MLGKFDLHHLPSIHSGFELEGPVVDRLIDVREGSLLPEDLVVQVDGTTGTIEMQAYAQQDGPSAFAKAGDSLPDLIEVVIKEPKFLDVD